jgi:hypothetical protein
VSVFGAGCSFDPQRVYGSSLRVERYRDGWLSHMRFLHVKSQPSVLHNSGVQLAMPWLSIFAGLLSLSCSLLLGQESARSPTPRQKDGRHQKSLATEPTKQQSVAQRDANDTSGAVDWDPAVIWDGPDWREPIALFVSGLVIVLPICVVVAKVRARRAADGASSRMCRLDEKLVRKAYGKSGSSKTAL